MGVPLTMGIEVGRGPDVLVVVLILLSVTAHTLARRTLLNPVQSRSKVNVHIGYLLFRGEHQIISTNTLKISVILRVRDSMCCTMTSL